MDILNSCLDLCEQPKSSPHNYLRSITPKSSELKYVVAEVAKIMSSRSGAGNDGQNKILGQMFIQGFDDEQIWQQIELRNNLKSYVPRLNKILISNTEVRLPYVKKSNLSDPSLVAEKSNELAKSDSVINNDSTSEDEESCDEENIASDHSENTEKEQALASVNHDNTSLKRKTLSNGDMFFNLQQMESFLDQAEKEKEEVADQHGDIDYFSDMASDDEDSSQPMYDDFFGDVADRNKPMLEEDEDLSEDEELDEGTTSPKKRTKKDIGNQDELQSSKKVRFMSEDEETSDDDSGKPEINEKSSFEKKEYRLKEQIAKMEEKALSEKPWPQRGEIDAQGRPLNSLLEEIVDIDLTSRPAPMMTEKVSYDLETIIKTRIKDKAFDDVERKIKPVHVQRELKKELVLNQEKSKFSLAQIYEQEYLSKQEASNNQEPVEDNEMTKEKEEILKMMKSVFKKLDTLSNFHYTPKPVLDELTIISNAPAISIEEALPTAVSEGSTLAPQEIAGSKKKVLVGKDERSKTDKLRERRKKKAFLSKKFKKSKDQSAPLTKILKSKKVSLVETTGKDKEIKTSAKFFKQLQDNADSGFLTKKPKETAPKQKPHK